MSVTSGLGVRRKETEVTMLGAVDLHGEAIALQPSTNEGFEVRTVVDGALDTGMRIAVTFHWIEI